MDDLSIATFADDLIDYLRASGIGKPVLGGISMGAAIALRIAIMAPELVKALVIARPAWINYPAPENMQPNAYVAELLEAFSPEEANRRFEASTVAKNLQVTGPDNLISLRGFFSRQPFDVTTALLRRISADGPGVSEQQIRGITVPTLIIGHERDFVHPIAYARALADWIPGARFVEITPKAESPEAYRSDFQAALAAFLKEL